jgi:hypothetical protein
MQAGYRTGKEVRSIPHWQFKPTLGVGRRRLASSLLTSARLDIPSTKPVLACRCELDRLARSTRELLELIERIDTADASFNGRRQHPIGSRTFGVD